MGKYMTPRMGENLKRFKYDGEDKSLLYVHVLTPMNKVLINYVPYNLAPNTLTLIGFAFILSAHLITYAYSPRFDQPLPPWVCVWCAISFFCYQTIDNLDGRQARRVGASSPLGLLFDHGIDALNTTVATLVVMSVFQVGVTWTALMLWAISNAAFLFATWEEFFVGKLTLGVVNGPSDGIMLCVISFLMSARSPGMWATPMGQTPWIASLLGEGSSLLGLPLYWLPLAPVAAGLVPTALLCAHAVYIGGHQRHWTEPLAKLFPFAQHLGLYVAWAFLSPSDIFHSHPRTFLFANGFLFCSMICKLMLAHLCDVDFKIFRSSSLPLTIAVASSLLPVVAPGALPLVSEATALQAVLAVHFATYAHFVYHVINEITDVLRIRCFVITEEQKAANRARLAAEAQRAE